MRDFENYNLSFSGFFFFVSLSFIFLTVIANTVSLLSDAHYMCTWISIGSSLEHDVNFVEMSEYTPSPLNELSSNLTLLKTVSNGLREEPSVGSMQKLSKWQHLSDKRKVVQQVTLPSHKYHVVCFLSFCVLHRKTKLRDLLQSMIFFETWYCQIKLLLSPWVQNLIFAACLFLLV